MRPWEVARCSGSVLATPLFGARVLLARRRVSKNVGYLRSCLGATESKPTVDKENIEIERLWS
jgi:hypothetical protein